MAISIKDHATDAAIRELAALTGETITEATRRAIEERLRRVRSAQQVDEFDIDAIIERGRQRPILDSRSADDIIGYDEIGLPR